MSFLVKNFLLILVCFLLFVRQASAVSVSITHVPSSISTDPFVVSVAVSGATAGTNYLRVDLYQDGTTDYFGETYTGNDWYSGSDGTAYFPITIGSDKTWTGDVQARIGSTIPNDYTGTGGYFLRVRRYTAGGAYNNDEAKANAVPVAIAFPTFTPAPTITPTPAPTAKPTKSPEPTSTPKPEKSTTSAGSTTAYSSVLGESITGDNQPISIDPSENAGSLSAVPTSILTARKASQGKDSNTSPKQLEKKQPANLLLQIVMLCIGGALFIACGILMYVKKKHG